MVQSGVPLWRARGERRGARRPARRRPTRAAGATRNSVPKRRNRKEAKGLGVADRHADSAQLSAWDSPAKSIPAKELRREGGRTAVRVPPARRAPRRRTRAQAPPPRVTRKRPALNQAVFDGWCATPLLGP